VGVYAMTEEVKVNDDDTIVEVNDLYIMISKRDGTNMRHYWKNNKDVLFVLNRLIDIYQRKR
tara:strand:+ start:3724 stop:3909 length:186 start_codon:yes stop_codon:yes gene_type:complete